LSVFCQYQSIVSQYVHKVFTLSVFDTVQGCIYNIYKASFSPGTVQQIGISDLYIYIYIERERERERYRQRERKSKTTQLYIIIYSVGQNYVSINGLYFSCR
jgi:hypothetical protein